MNKGSVDIYETLGMFTYLQRVEIGLELVCARCSPRADLFVRLRNRLSSWPGLHGALKAHLADVAGMLEGMEEEELRHLGAELLKSSGGPFPKDERSFLSRILGERRDRDLNMESGFIVFRSVIRRLNTISIRGLAEAIVTCDFGGRPSFTDPLESIVYQDDEVWCVLIGQCVSECQFEDDELRLAIYQVFLDELKRRSQPICRIEDVIGLLRKRIEAQQREQAALKKKERLEANARRLLKQSSPEYLESRLCRILAVFDDTDKGLLANRISKAFRTKTPLRALPMHEIKSLIQRGIGRSMTEEEAFKLEMIYRASKYHNHSRGGGKKKKK